MASDSFMGKIRSFFGLRPEPPKTEFRNPIWGSDDDDDGDELYSKEQNIDVYTNLDFHEELSKHVHDMLKGFGSMFSDMRTFFHDDPFHNRIDSFTTMSEVPCESENVDSNTIRQYYLKPGYNISKPIEHKDMDLDGKLSSEDISGMFKKKQGPSKTPGEHLDGSLVPGRAFCQTVITTSITKPDGTIETRRIVKSGNEVIEESTTTSPGPDPRGSQPGLDTLSSTGIILSELASLFRNFY